MPFPSQQWINEILTHHFEHWEKSVKREIHTAKWPAQPLVGCPDTKQSGTFADHNIFYWIIHISSVYIQTGDSKEVFLIREKEKLWAKQFLKYKISLTGWSTEWLVYLNIIFTYKSYIFNSVSDFFFPRIKCFDPFCWRAHQYYLNNIKLVIDSLIGNK